MCARKGLPPRAGIHHRTLDARYPRLVEEGARQPPGCPYLGITPLDCRVRRHNPGGSLLLRYAKYLKPSDRAARPQDSIAAAHNQKLLVCRDMRCYSATARI